MTVLNEQTQGILKITWNPIDIKAGVSARVVEFSFFFFNWIEQVVLLVTEPCLFPTLLVSYEPQLFLMAL